MDNRTFTIELTGNIGDETVSDLAAWASLSCRGTDAVRMRTVRSDSKQATVEVSPASTAGETPMVKRIRTVTTLASERCGLVCVVTGAK